MSRIGRRKSIEVTIMNKPCFQKLQLAYLEVQTLSFGAKISILFPGATHLSRGGGYNPLPHCWSRACYYLIYSKNYIILLLYKKLNKGRTIDRTFMGTFTYDVSNFLVIFTSFSCQKLTAFINPTPLMTSAFATPPI